MIFYPYLAASKIGNENSQINNDYLFCGQPNLLTNKINSQILIITNVQKKLLQLFEHEYD
jgi:hypothetical protein